VDSSAVEPGAAEKKGAEGIAKYLKELKIFTETVLEEVGKTIESGVIDADIASVESIEVPVR
jgi:hypothetical protein